MWLAPDRLAQELDRAKQGVLVKLPRDEFEELVRRAAQAEAARKEPPRLVEAHYHAELADGALVGSCQWKVVHTAAAPGLLPLSPLNLALREPRFENGDALIADFDGREPSLLVETPGDHSASVGWSARAEARPEGLQFDLRLPASPAAVLELDLPADRTVHADGGGLSGPHPSGTPNLNRWTIACGGRSQISLLVRAADQLPVIRASQQTVQVLTPTGLDATFTFTLQALHQGARELVFDCDPELRPYDVTAPGLEKWEVVAPVPDRPTPHLLVRLADPLEEGTVQVRCLAPLAAAVGPNPVTWTSPGMHLRQGVPGGETLVLKVDPDLRLAALRPGGFRLKEAGTESQPDGQAALQRLTFVGGGVAEAGAPLTPSPLPSGERGRGEGGPRPQAVLYPHGVEFRARQLAWWRVDPTRSSLTLQIAYEVSYGRLFQMAVRLPVGWEVGRVDLAPAGLLRNWSVGQVNGAPALLVDLQKPLAPAEKARCAARRSSSTWNRPTPTTSWGAKCRFPTRRPWGRASAKGPWPSVSTNRPTGWRSRRRPRPRRRRMTGRGERKYLPFTTPIGSKRRTDGRRRPAPSCWPRGRRRCAPSASARWSCRPASPLWTRACFWKLSRAAPSRWTCICPPPACRRRRATRGAGRAA